MGPPYLSQFFFCLEHDCRLFEKSSEYHEYEVSKFQRSVTSTGNRRLQQLEGCGRGYKSEQRLRRRLSGNGTFVVLSFFCRRRRPCAEAALRPRWRPALQCRQKTSERVCAPQPKQYVVAAADTRLGCYVQFFFLNILLAALSFRTACMKFFSNDINDCIVIVRCIENQSRLYTSHNGLKNRH